MTPSSLLMVSYLSFPSALCWCCPELAQTDPEQSRNYSCIQEGRKKALTVPIFTLSLVFSHWSLRSCISQQHGRRGSHCLPPSQELTGPRAASVWHGPTLTFTNRMFSLDLQVYFDQLPRSYLSSKVIRPYFLVSLAVSPQSSAGLFSSKINSTFPQLSGALESPVFLLECFSLAVLVQGCRRMELSTGVKLFWTEWTRNLVTQLEVPTG